MKLFYGFLCFLGIALPYGVFLPWVMENGLNPVLLVVQAFETSISSFAWLDVIISAIVTIGFILFEGKRLVMNRLWIPVLGTLTVGVSFGLPLFLFMREVYLEKKLRN